MRRMVAVYCCVRVCVFSGNGMGCDEVIGGVGGWVEDRG